MKFSGKSDSVTFLFLEFYHVTILEKLMNKNREKLVTVVSRTDVCMDKNEFKGPSLLGAGGQQVSR